MIQFGDWRPDASDFDPQFLANMRGAQPAARGWRPHPALEQYLTALPAKPVGAAIVRDSDGGYHIYAGTKTNIYRYNPTGSWDSKGSGYSLSDGHYWSFRQFGGRLVASVITDNIQTIDIDSNGTASDLVSFKCRELAIIGKHLFAVGLLNEPSRTRWCATGDATKWDLAEFGASDQTFFEDGWIYAITGNSRGGFVYLKGGIYRATWQPGQTFNFAFEKIATLGLAGPRAVASVNDADFFLSDRGFYQISLQGLNPIGAGKVDEYFFTNVDREKLDEVQAVADPINKVIYWAYSSSANTSENFDRIIGYNWQLGRWFRMEETVELLALAATPGNTLDSLDSFGTLDSLKFSLDSPVWTRGTPLFGAFNTSHELCFAQGSPKDALFETADIEHNSGHRSLVTSAHLLSDCENATLKVGTKATPYDDVSWSSAVSRQVSGRYPMRANGKYHRYRAELSGDWVSCHGLDEITVKRAGMR